MATYVDINGTNVVGSNIPNYQSYDVIYGIDGDDQIYSFYQYFTEIFGGRGNDSIIIDTNAGYGNVYGDSGNDILRGGNRTDHLYGGEGADSLYGNDGIDYLFGGVGADQMEGATMMISCTASWTTI